MAHKKGVGSTDNGRDSIGRRLGVKLFGGQAAKAGNIIVRQRGTRYHAGENVYLSKDFTLHAAVNGTVAFKKKRLDRVFVSIIPADVVVEKAAPAPKKKAKPAVSDKKTKGAETVAEAPVAKAAAPVVEKVKETKPAKEEAPKASKSGKITLPSGKKIKQDDLKLVEGIGPKIEGLLHDGGIKTWADLADAPGEKVQAILDEAGPRYNMHDPATWAAQAKLAAEGKWEELETLQDNLKGGKVVEDED
ncbi:MAG: hypothetical protein DHS20C18_34960 [Saprospiraceae bacterium]|nr:MAG: hypothetical protein DHS20C18_34960 [Saprospiraceae bacterium]